MNNAERWLGRGLPLIISTHSINFHSTISPFRQKTLPMFRELLAGLQKRYPTLVYVNTRQMLEMIETGTYETGAGKVAVTVTNGKRA